MNFYLIEAKHFEEKRVIEGHKKSMGSIRFLGKIDQNALNGKLYFYTQMK